MTILEILSPSTRKESVEQSAVQSSQTRSGRTMVMEMSSSNDVVNPSSADDDESVAEAVLEETNGRKKQTNADKSVFHKVLHKIQEVRKLCGKAVNDTRVQLLIIFLIAINAIMLGVGTYPFVKDNPDRARKFDTTDQVFLILFTVELAMQFIYRGFHLFTDGWLIFDFIIIVMSWSFSELQIVRAFRIFRAFRLITRVKVLQNLVTALFSVVPRIGAITLLLFLIFFIFAILMTSLWKNLPLETGYFARLDATFFTLFQILTLDEWAGIAREVMAIQSWAWLPIIAFVIITAFIVINLIIAVICDAISALHASQKAMLHGSNNDEEDEEDPEEELDEIDLKKQLQTLEQQVEELARMQNQTMHSLQYLTRHLQSKKMV